VLCSRFIRAGVVQWQYRSFPSFGRGFDSHRPLQFSAKISVDSAALTRDQAFAITEIREDTTGGTGDGEAKQVLRITVKFVDKLKELELLCRHIGLLKDTINVNLRRDEEIIEGIAEGRKRAQEQEP
jgi:hypothetical protein